MARPTDPRTPRPSLNGRCYCRDPDCDAGVFNASVILGCGTVPEVARHAPSGEAVEADDEAILDDTEGLDVVIEELPDESVIIATRVCSKQDGGTDTSGAALSIGVCDYTLPGWVGSGSLYNAADGV